MKEKKFMRVCSVNGCYSRHKAKGYCGKHYIHFKRQDELLEPSKGVLSSEPIKESDNEKTASTPPPKQLTFPGQCIQMGPESAKIQQLNPESTKIQKLDDLLKRREHTIGIQALQIKNLKTALSAMIGG